MKRFLLLLTAFTLSSTAYFPHALLAENFEKNLINFELNWEDKIVLKSVYSPEKNWEATIHLKNIDLTKLGDYFKNFELKRGYIEGELNLEGKKKYLLKGNLKIEDIILTKGSNEFGGNIDLSCQATLFREDISYSLEANLHEGRFNSFFPIKADFNLSKDKLILKEACIEFKKIPLKIRGELEGFLFPKIVLNIDSSPLKVEVKGKYDKKKFKIDEWIIRGKESKISSQAEIEMKEKPQGKIEGAGVVNFGDVLELTNLLDVRCPGLIKLNPQGALNIKFVLEGGLNGKELKTKLAGYSQRLKIYNLELTEVKIELLKDKGELIVSPLIARLEEGEIDFRTKLDFLNNKGIINFILNGIDLAYLRKRLELENKNLAGKLSLEIYLKNTLPQWDKWEGKGALYIKEGNIWEINLLKGLGEFLFIPGYEKIKFDKCYTDLIFKGKEIVLENLELNSSQMDLKGGGKITFQEPLWPPLRGDIEFMLFPEFNPDLISASESLKKILTDFLGKGGLVIEIKGTLKEPKYKIKPFFLAPLEGIKDFFKNLWK